MPKIQLWWSFKDGVGPIVVIGCLGKMLKACSAEIIEARASTLVIRMTNTMSIKRITVEGDRQNIIPFFLYNKPSSI